MAGVNAVLDVQTGGGERFTEVLSQLSPPRRHVVATESWSSNVAIVKRNLGAFDASIMDHLPTYLETPNPRTVPF